MPAVEIEIELSAVGDGALDADRAAIGHGGAQIVDANIVALRVKRGVNLIDRNALEVNVVGGRRTVNFELLEIVADAVDAEVGGDSPANIFERGNVIGEAVEVDGVSFDVSVEGGVRRLIFDVAADGAAEGVGDEIRQVDGVIEVLEMSADVGGVKVFVGDRRDGDIGVDQRALDGAGEFGGEGGNAVDGDGGKHGARLEAVGGGADIEIRRLAVDANRAADVGKLIVGGNRGVDENFLVVEIGGAVDAVDDGLLDEDGAAGDIRAPVEFDIIALHCDAYVEIRQGAVENLNALGDRVLGNEREVIVDGGAGGGDVKSFAAAEHGDIGDQFFVESAPLDVRLEIIRAVDFGVGIDRAELDGNCFVGGGELPDGAVDGDIIGAGEFEIGIDVLSVERPERFVEPLRAELAVDELDIGVEIGLAAARGLNVVEIPRAVFALDDTALGARQSEA